MSESTKLSDALPLMIEFSKNYPNTVMYGYEGEGGTWVVLSDPDSDACLSIHQYGGKYQLTEEVK